VTGGVRVDRSDVDYELTTLATGELTNLARTDTETSWRAGVVYKPNAGLYLPALALWLWFYARPGFRGLLVVALGAIVPTVLTLAWLAAQGHQEVHLAGKGWGTFPATFAALLSPVVKQVTLKNALTSYADASALSEAIATATSSRVMPPWPADASGACGTFVEPRWLGDGEHHLLADLLLERVSPRHQVVELIVGKSLRRI
jgi:hypothetical protein